MPKPEISLQPSESTVTHCAVQLYAAYVIAGKVEDGQEKEWMQRALKQAVQFAQSAEGIAAGREEEQAPEALPDTGEASAQPPTVQPDENLDPLPVREGLRDLSARQQKSSRGKIDMSATEQKGQPSEEDILEIIDSPEEATETDERT